ncbi:MAG: hypothetical protein P8Y51_08550 [Campylobacterales bacterium]
MTLDTVGSNREKLDALAARFGIAFESCGPVDEAVRRIAPAHTKESVALLSPACASLDQFPSYAVRGDTFKKAVAALS